MLAGTKFGHPLRQLAYVHAQTRKNISHCTRRNAWSHEFVHCFIMKGRKIFAMYQCSDDQKTLLIFATYFSSAFKSFLARKYTVWKNELRARKLKTYRSKNIFIIRNKLKNKKNSDFPHWPWLDAIQTRIDAQRNNNFHAIRGVISFYEFTQGPVGH